MFKRKNILIILPYYFEYQKQIKKHLEKRGAHVYMINEDVNEFSFLHKSISIYCHRFYEFILRKYYKKQFAILPDNLDAILIIKGSTISAVEIRFLKVKYPETKLIMYQWDSIAHYKKAVEVAKWCDVNITFDPVDSFNHNWKYRALFFDPDLCSEEIRKTIDISYICSVHSERVRLYNEILRYAKDKKIKLLDYLFSDKWSYYRQKYIKRNKLFQINSACLKFKPLSSYETAKIYDQSIAVLDFKFTRQIGLTMRTIESLGHRCKLITNNKQIINEDFYNPENIFVYDIDNFDIPLSFIRSAYVPLSQDIYYKYSVDGWLDEVFAGTLS